MSSLIKVPKFDVVKMFFLLFNILPKTCTPI